MAEDLYLNQSFYHAGAIYLQTLGELHRMMVAARLEKDAERWFVLIDVTVSGYSQPWTPDERDRVQNKVDEINALINPSAEGARASSQVDRYNQAYALLRVLEREVMMILYQHGLLAPRTINPAHAVTQGTG